MMDKPPWETTATLGAAARLTVPARPDFVHMLRALASSAAARADFTYDDLEDLTLAVSEAAAYLLKLQPAASRLSLAVTPSDDSIAIAVSVDGPVEHAPTPDGVQWMMWHVLGALAGEASLVYEDDGPAIRFTKAKATR